MKMPGTRKRERIAAAHARAEAAAAKELAEKRRVASTKAAVIGQSAIGGFASDFKTQKRKVTAEDRAARKRGDEIGRERKIRARFDVPLLATYNKATAIFLAMTEPKLAANPHGHGGHHRHHSDKPRPPAVKSTKESEHLAFKPYDKATTEPISLGADPDGKELVIQLVKEVDERYRRTEGKKASMSILLSARHAAVPNEMTLLGSLQLGYNATQLDHAGETTDVPFNTWFVRGDIEQGSADFVTNDGSARTETIGELKQALKAFDAIVELTAALTGVGTGDPVNKTRSLNAIAYIGGSTA